MQVMRFVSSKEYVRSKRFLHSFWVYQIFLFFPHTSSLVFLFSSSLIFSSFTLSLSFAFIPQVITQSSHIQTQFLFRIITFSVRFSRSRTKPSFVVIGGPVLLLLEVICDFISIKALSIFNLLARSHQTESSCREGNASAVTKCMLLCITVNELVSNEGEVTDMLLTDKTYNL